MKWLLLGILLLVIVGIVGRRRANAARLADARADAQRWYERLGGQVMNLHGDAPAVRQALVDAGERFTAAGSQLEQARSVHQYALARETALEGLAYARAARVALGLDPGPELPQLAAARGAGMLTKDREVNVQGQVYQAGPQPAAGKPYYYPGGRVHGRPVPAGWYSQPVWRSAVTTGASVLGAMLIYDALFSPAFGDPGYAEGSADGGGDSGGGGGDSGDGGGDSGGADSGGDIGGGDIGGFGGFGDFGGGDFGGGGDF